jgi:hypothetical protein
MGLEALMINDLLSAAVCVPTVRDDVGTSSQWCAY